MLATEDYTKVYSSYMGGRSTLGIRETRSSPVNFFGPRQGFIVPLPREQVP